MDSGCKVVTGDGIRGLQDAHAGTIAQIRFTFATEWKSGATNKGCLASNALKKHVGVQARSGPRMRGDCGVGEACVSEGAICV